MKGDSKVIDALNEILTGELTAINQYFLHARMCKNWGYERIAAKVWAESIDEMKHAQALTDRILFLEGLPNLQKLGKLNIGETVEEQFQADLALEFQAMTNLKAAIKVCFEAADHTTRELFEHILADEEAHVDWLEAQLGLIKDLGRTAYLAEQINKGE
ncbi:MAG: bacterioferritin [Deltaproteobacteria bacterium]|nr:bacterioferritin [Deltaproteobacteria bacterium]